MEKLGKKSTYKLLLLLLLLLLIWKGMKGKKLQTKTDRRLSLKLLEFILIYFSFKSVLINAVKIDAGNPLDFFMTENIYQVLSVHLKLTNNVQEITNKQKNKIYVNSFFFNSLMLQSQC